jgi:hypothetical protein
MFETLRDAVRRMWSWRWPAVTGEITDVDLRRVRNLDQADLGDIGNASMLGIDKSPFRK